jgi:hypothetical protein
MKCPHCGIEVRDTTVICGYCGGKIPQKKGMLAMQKGGRADTGGIAPKNAPPAKKSIGGEPESDGEDEEEGGLSAYLQPGEQVKIGSLNISVKKFFFHAYLTDRRIFLIDTQEKKLKVTAKDIPLETISGSIVEFSEASDPVLVLSIRSADDETKTMKLVFAQNGIDRSAEIDEWITLLNEQTQPKKHKKAPAQKVPEPEPEEEEEVQKDQPAPAQVTKPAPVRQELYPAKKPVKDYERQPPVKRLLSMYQAPKEEEPQEPAPRRPEVRAAEQPARRVSPQPVAYREIPPTSPPVAQPVKKVEVQSAMKSAMKTAMQPVRQPLAQPVKRSFPEPQKKIHPEPEVPPVPERRKEPVEQEEPAQEEEVEGPFFCQNCGKKLPSAANFCPGCGSKLGYHKPAHEAKPSHEKKVRKIGDESDDENLKRPPAKPPAKKAPKGSEMTILHKFLRR